MSGDAPELWNFDQPDKIRALHQSFVDAGADILLVDASGTPYVLDRTACSASIPKKKNEQ